MRKQTSELRKLTGSETTCVILSHYAEGGNNGAGNYIWWKLQFRIFMKVPSKGRQN